MFAFRTVHVAAFCAALVAMPGRAITTFGPDPNDPLYSSPGAGPHSGVARLLLTFSFGTFGCTGSLLSTGMHILTAGHCVTDFFGAELPGSATARFVTASGNTDIALVMYRVFPAWDGGLFSGTDLAVAFLASMAPVDAARYDIYRAMDEVGQTGELVGFGIAGSGATGPLLGFGTRRRGLNRYDAQGDFFTGISANILMGDFDNGVGANDAFGVAGLPNLGLSMDEVDIASGDSGGPTFLAGRIAGVHSFGASFGTCPPDVITPPNLHGPAGCKLDSSFGEFFGDTRASAFQAFVDNAIPEPGTMALLGIGLIALAALGRRRPRS